MVLTRPLRGGIPFVAALIAAAAAVVYFLGVRQLSAPEHHLIPAYLLFVMFGLSEVFVVHLEFRGDAQTFSLVEIPLVLGFFFASADAIVPAHVLGAGVALALYRRQPPRKLFYNLASFALEDGLALLTLDAIADRLDPLLRQTWLAASAGTLVASAVGILSVFAAIALSGGTQSAQDRREAVIQGFAVTLAATSIALAAAVLLRIDTTAAWLLAVPSAGLYLAHQAHVRSRNEQRSLTFLQSSAGLLHSSPDAAQSLRTLLERAREALRADIAAVAYISESDPDSLARLVAGPGEHVGELESVPVAAGLAEWDAVVPSGSGVLLHLTRAPAGRLIGDAEITGGMIAPLLIEGRRVGYLLVANRLGDVGRFTAADVDVFITLAAHIAVGIEDGQLEQPLHQLRVLERQLEYRASHDPVTGLPNEQAFKARLAEEIAEAEPGTLAVLLIDVETTEAATRIAAERLRRCVRDVDVLARISGQRFAVLATAPAGSVDATGVALRIQNRIEQSLRRPLVIDGVTVRVTVRAGFDVNAERDEPLLLLKRASADIRQ